MSVFCCRNFPGDGSWMISSKKREIVEFFLNIFKLQMNLSGRAGQYRLISGADATADQIFELRVQGKEEWVSRRMTISPLGDESGSKSKCFKVIYDDMIVVKIPPAPITDFSKYFESIQAERRIAQQLEPEIRCVTPSLSAILRKIPPFSNELDIDFRRFEERCYQKISILPIFQKYLKIGNTFAFFMNLSQYVFLGQIVSEMHDIEEAVNREILSHTDILGSPLLFEEIYGSDRAAVFFALDGLYGACEEAVQRLQFNYDITAIDSYSKKEWFLTHLVGNRVEPGDDHFPPDFIDDLNGLIEKILDTEPAVIDMFRKTMRVHVYQKLFFQNKSRMGGVISNLLEHLAILKRKKIAMRDLKPDNIFIAGDMSEDPFLLETPEKYSIGLIDFETSVIFKHAGDKAIPQPMLAGTPSYFTVSHVFMNDILSQIYPSLSRILHLQDWYAVNSMIYNVITGQRLSQETGRLMQRMIRDMKACARKNVSRIEIYRKYSNVFWRTATAEFERKLGICWKMLRDVKVPIPKSSKAMLAEEIESSRSAVRRQMVQLLKNPSLPLSSRDINGLSSASCDMLVQLRDRWDRGVNVPNVPESSRNQILDLLKRLVRLKRDWEGMERFLSWLAVSKPIVPADRLLVVMFNTVLYGMHHPDWGDTAGEAARTAAPSDLKSDEADATRTYEETMELESTVTQIMDSPSRR